MFIVRDFSNRFQELSGMPINSKGGKKMLKKAMPEHPEYRAFR